MLVDDLPVRVHGHSYAAEVYDRIVPAALAHVAANATVKASVVSMLSERSDVDSLTLARIQKDREAALARYLRDRDPAALEDVMTRLDTEEAEARALARPVDREEALAYLANLPRLWNEAAPERRQQIAGALFERIDVLGLKEATIHPSPEAMAHGWRAAWGDEILTGAYRGDYGRGERSWTSRFHTQDRAPRMDQRSFSEITLTDQGVTSADQVSRKRSSWSMSVGLEHQTEDTRPSSARRGLAIWSVQEESRG